MKVNYELYQIVQKEKPKIWTFEVCRFLKIEDENLEHAPWKRQRMHLSFGTNTFPRHSYLC